MKIIGIVGPAGSGKDTVADAFVEAGWCKIAFADELKRTAKRWYNFSDEQLWGPSEKRNEVDERYPREHGPFETLPGINERGQPPWVDRCVCCFQIGRQGQCGLTPRFVLRMLGTEVGRIIYGDTWVNLLVDTADRLLSGTRAVSSQLLRWTYDQRVGMQRVSAAGVSLRTPTGIVVPDVRHENEARALRKVGGKILRVHRPGVGVSSSHTSETEQVEIRSDHEIYNCGSVEDLRRAGTAFMNELPLRDAGWL